jgi:hypothetical protein
MKRFFIIVGIVLLIAGCAGGKILYDKKKQFTGDIDKYKIVSIQINPNLFYPVRVPEEANLIRSNFETAYDFDIIDINKYDALPEIYDIEVEVEGTHVVANSPKNILLATQEGFKRESTFTFYVNWESKTYVDEILVLPSLPDGATQQPNSTYTDGVADTVIADTAVTWYTDDGFLQSVVLFSDYYEAVDAYAAKFVGVYGSDFVEYHNQDGVFFATDGEFFVGVRYINKNTQYAISGKGQTIYPYFMQSLYNGGSPVGKGGDVTFIPKGTINEADR